MSRLRPRCGFVLNLKPNPKARKIRLVCSMAAHAGREHLDEKQRYWFNEKGEARRWER